MEREEIICRSDYDIDSIKEMIRMMKLMKLRPLSFNIIKILFKNYEDEKYKL